MSATASTLAVEPEVRNFRSSWSEFESLTVQTGKKLPGQALVSVREDAQERVIDPVGGARWALVRGLAAPFVVPRR